MIAPWPSTLPLGILIGLCGLVAVAYQLKAFRNKRKLDFVLLHWADRIPHAIIPVLGNALLVAAAIGAISGTSYAPYAIAGASALLLSIGIYGAWDLTLWLVKTRTTAST
jgi:hypothetical protein